MSLPFTKFSATLRCAIFCLAYLFPALSQSPVVSEIKSDNGVRLLLANRPGSSAAHAAWFIKGGYCDTAPCPPEAADMLLSTWFAQSNFYGASGLWIKTGADWMAHGRDIPAESLEDWCRTEFSRLSQAITQEQTDTARKEVKQLWTGSNPIGKLFALALKGSAYAMSERKDITALASISKDDLTVLAQKYVTAERLTIVLVGDITESEALKAVEDNFGTLTASSGPPAETQIPQKNEQDDVPSEKRSTEISSETATEVLVAWQIPPFSHDGWAYLAFFAEVLNGNAYSWLRHRLVTELGCSNNVQVLVGEPSGMGASLFIARANVNDGHTAQEARQAILAAVQDSLRDELSFIEINSAMNRLDVKHARRLAEASGLAQELIYAYGSTGGWEQAVRQPSYGINLEPASFKSFLQPIFSADLAYSVLVEQDPILSPRSQEHQRLISLLRHLLEKGGHPPELMENKIKETLRQFGLMPNEMRGQLFLLLEAEVGR